MIGRSDRPPSLSRDLAILAGGEAATRAATFVAFVHLARALGPAAFGLVEVALAVMIFLTGLVDQGLGVVGTREVARRPHEVESLVTRVVSTQLMAAAIVYGLLAVAVVGVSQGNALGGLLLGFGLTLFGAPLRLAWVYQGRHEMTMVAGLQALRWSTFAALVLVFVGEPGQLARVPAAEILAVALVATVALLRFRRGGGRLRLSLAGWDRGLWREGLPIGASNLIWTLRTYLPVVLLGALAGEAAVGFFAAAHRIFMVLQALLGMYFMGVFPRLSRLSGTALLAFLRRSVHVAVWPSAALALAVTVAAPEVIYLVFGAEYVRDGAPATLAVLVWTLPVLACRGQGRAALIVMSRQDDELVCSLVGLALLAALAVPLGAAYGPLGIAWAMLSAELAATALIWWRLRRRAPELASPVVRHAR